MKIRLAKQKDSKQLIRLCELHAIYEGASYDSTHKEALLTKHLFDGRDTVKCFVAEKEELIVGYATCMKQFSTWDANFYLYLDCLYVIEAVRGKGLGTLLMHRIKEYAIAENCEVIQWQTPVANKGAIAFYHQLGAESTPKERFFWRI